MLETLKEEVLAANVGIREERLAILTWGNASGYDPGSGLVVIKGSGVPYEEMTTGDLSVFDLEGNRVEGSTKPSTDLPTHIELYRSFPGLRGIVHAHSPYATAWAQTGQDIPCYGTTHADYFPGDIPCTRVLGAQEVGGNYEDETGKAIIERFAGIDPMRMRGVLVRYHGPFVWGDGPLDALHNAMVLEYVAGLEWRSFVLSRGGDPEIDPELMRKHYDRKFGEDSYYGQ